MDYEKITGEITEYIYTSEESMYKVCNILTSSNEEISAVGSFPYLDIGLNYDFVGYYTNHPKYGKQFSIKSYQKNGDYTEAGLISYLSSDRFPGIGEKLAARMVDALGLNLIDKIINDPDILDGVKGVTKQKKEVLFLELKNGKIEEEMYIKLYGFGLTSKMIQKLYENYGISTLNKIEEDPYRLIYEVDGFGFKRADSIALKLGYLPDDIRRVEACIVFCLNYVCYKQGFTFLTKEQLINATISALDEPSIKNEKYEEALESLVSKEKIIKEDNLYYDTFLYRCETNLVEKIDTLNKTSYNENKKEKLIEAINEVEAHLGMTYTPLQQEAIFNSLSNKLSIITGGPGTGKSTILKGILYTYASLNELPLDSDELMLKALLVSPTGRAAKRMSEVTVFKASTIHKALSVNYDGTFKYNRESLLPCSLLIVDEVSMLDVSLAWSLLQALSNKCQVILVGDINQLPSVGPGNVLADLINSNVFKVTRLTQIIRQSSDSNIVKLSNMVLAERIDYTVFNDKKDVFLYELKQEEIIGFLIRILDKYIQAGNDLFSSMQILIPMYNGVVGINEINRVIQEKFNPSTDFVKRGDLLIKVNDKVLQTKNDPSLKIMNGDIGRVLEIRQSDSESFLRINSDGLIVDYPTRYIDNLSLAYAVSIHKAQGSEFENVIMLLDSSYYVMLRKKIVYTGLTRAKKKLIILGSRRVLASAITNLDPGRQTSLGSRLQLNKVNRNKIYDKDIPFDTLGEYDMEGITPYSFMK